MVVPDRVDVVDVTLPPLDEDDDEEVVLESGGEGLSAIQKAAPADIVRSPLKFLFAWQTRLGSQSATSQFARLVQNVKQSSTLAVFDCED